MLADDDVAHVRSQDVHGQGLERRPSQLVNERLSTTEWGRRIRKEVKVTSSDTEEWLQRQEQVFTRWINAKLSNAPPPLPSDVLVEELFSDLRDGLVLYYLLAVLSQGASVRLGKAQVRARLPPRLTRVGALTMRHDHWSDTLDHHHSSPSPPTYPHSQMGTLRIQHVQNVNIVLKYLCIFMTSDRQTLPDAVNIVDGHKTAILSLVWWIISNHNGAGFASDGQSLKKRTIEWAQQRLQGHFPIVSLKDDVFRDGRAFLALVSAADPYKFPYKPTDSAERNLHDAFEAAKQLYDVPILLTDPNDVMYEEAVMTYLSEMMPRLPTPGADDLATGTPAHLRSSYALNIDAIVMRLTTELSATGLAQYTDTIRQHAAELWITRAQGSASALLACLERLGVDVAEERVCVMKLLLDPALYPHPDAPPEVTLDRLSSELHHVGLGCHLALVRANLVELWCEREIGGAEGLDAYLIDMGVSDVEHRALLIELMLDP